jgi:DNA polymerase elongation subunit (family B)
MAERALRLDGHILDVFPDDRNDLMVTYLRTPHGVERVVDRYWPAFHVQGAPDDLRRLRARLEGLPSVREAELERRKADLLDGEEERDVLRVEVGRYREMSRLADMVDRLGGFRDFSLFNVDVRLAQRYLIDRGAFPLARVSVGRRIECLDERLALEYEVPLLRRAHLDVEGHRSGRVLRNEDPIARVTVTPMPPLGGPPGEAREAPGPPVVLEARRGSGGDGGAGGGGEAGVLAALTRELDRLDVDVLETTDGDSVAIPYLRAREQASGGELRLGREEDPGAPARKERSYFSYGRIIYKPPYQALRGRIHIDRGASFLHAEGGLFGLIDLARISYTPLQTLSRLSPGTAISAMQVHHALTMGHLVRWKKNVPETFKTAEELARLDRGGMVLEPRVGLFGGVVELDFASLYPNLIVKHNISPERIMCPCCHRPDRMVPGTPFHTCGAAEGLVPAVLRPVLQRRFYFKRMRDSRPERHDEYEEKQLVLKWLLVTCFGYTGYKNARYGRIECHESITAAAREVLLDAKEVAEAAGYEVLHGIVDSLWLRPLSPAATAPEVVADRVGRLMGVDLNIEGVYKWIAFLPCKGTGVGALNRYYGAMRGGKLKVRGVELRRRDSPPFVKAAQQEMLDVLARAEGPEGFLELVPEALAALRRRADAVRAGGVDPRELLFRNSASKGVEEYGSLNLTAAALRQLQAEGVAMQPGQSVQYVVTDAASRRWQDKVLVRERLDLYGGCDAAHYVKVLARAGESLLSPVGWGERRILDALDGQRQERLGT